MTDAEKRLRGAYEAWARSGRPNDNGPLVCEMHTALGAVEAERDPAPYGHIYMIDNDGMAQVRSFDCVVTCNVVTTDTTRR